MTRRERLERIATAERDRRAGRVELAIAALGEATEWPARAVLALARLPESAADETRRILEDGLDRWAEEAGLDGLDAPTHAPDDAMVDESIEAEAEADAGVDGDADETTGLPADADARLERPIDHGELERAFAEAEAQTDEMHGANDVAERVLMQEPLGLAELDGEGFAFADVDAPTEPDDPIAFADSRSADGGSGLEVDAASALPVDATGEAADDAAHVDGTSRAAVLATLERWLHNLEAGRAR